MYYKQPPNQEALSFMIMPRGYGKTYAAYKQMKGEKLPIAAIPHPSTQDTIKPENLFIGDRFRLPGSREWYTVVEEPKTNLLALQVAIHVKTRKGAYKTIRVDSRSNVYTNGTPTR